MRALFLAARRQPGLAEAMRAAALWLTAPREPRRWHSERERQAFLADCERRRLRHLMQPGTGRTKFM